MAELNAQTMLQERIDQLNERAAFAVSEGRHDLADAARRQQSYFRSQLDRSCLTVPAQARAA